MPIYEYQCKKCRSVFERITFTGEAEEILCSECGTTEVFRVLSATSFVGGSGLGACSPGSSSGFS
jgi:putative FmdB family regulatory protein